MTDPTARTWHVPLPVVEHEAGRTLVRFAFAAPGGPGSFEVWINRMIEPRAEALGAACAAFFLLPAMSAGARLVLDAPLPEAMGESLRVLGEIHSAWYPETFPAPVDVLAPFSRDEVSGSSGSALFFSGGVDSTFSLLRHQSSVSALIFVIGFDIAAGNADLAGEVSTMMRGAAGRYGLPLIEISSNLRDFADAHVHWGSHYCGAAMAGMAHLLAGEFGTVIIPGTLDWRDQAPFGSHPFTDERWSTPSLCLLHDSCDVDRLEKMRAIVADARGLRHLRVCWRNPGNAYNCCRCEKCLRALANLRALGALDAATTFPNHPVIEDLCVLDIDHDLVIPFVEQTIVEANRHGDRELADALAAAVVNHRVGRLTKVPKEFLADLPSSTIWQEHTFSAVREAVVEAAMAADPKWTRGKILHALPPDQRMERRPPTRRPWWRFW